MGKDEKMRIMLTDMRNLASKPFILKVSVQRVPMDIIIGWMASMLLTVNTV